MPYERYAIYWAPKRGSPLAEFGRRWLCGLAETGGPHKAGEILNLVPDLAERATASPRRYGLHATMKAPFQLAPGTTEEELANALAAFCARRRPARSGPLGLHRFSRYLALVPQSARAEIEWLADECVTHFDRFRASLDPADRARRSSGLSPLEQTHFEQFGYPHVFSRFFFHVTLAGPLEADELDEVEAALAPAVAPFTKDPFSVNGLCLFGDPGGGGLFKILHRCPLMD